MRKQWFGDSRDYANWNFLFNEAGQEAIVCYIAMVRPDELAEHIHPTVKAFFERYKDLGLVSQMFEGRFASLLSPYSQKRRNTYFGDAQHLVRKAQIDGPVVIFLDPDTGIEPPGKSSDKHVRLEDVSRMAEILRTQDKLIIYQHAPIMRKASWIQDALARVGLQHLTAQFRIRHHYDPKCASDVFFVVIERS